MEVFTSNDTYAETGPRVYGAMDTYANYTLAIPFPRKTIARPTAGGADDTAVTAAGITTLMESVGGQIFVAVFIFVCLFLLLNILLAIVMKAYAQVRWEL